MCTAASRVAWHNSAHGTNCCRAGVAPLETFVRRGASQHQVVRKMTSAQVPSLTPQLTGHTVRISGPFVGWSHACSAAIFAQLVALSRLGCSAVMSRPSISESSAHAAAPTPPVALVLEVAVGVPANRTNKPGQPGRLGRQHKKASTGYARRVAAPIVARRRIGGGLHESRRMVRAHA